jgi:hypothetical protein
MVFYAGVRERTWQIGYVADYCPICHEIRVCKLMRTVSYPHVYFLRVGSETIKGHQVFCSTCGSLLHGDVEKYTGVQRDLYASMEDLIKGTNPELEERVLEILEAEECVAKGDMDPEDRMALIAKPFLVIEDEVRRNHMSMDLDSATRGYLLLAAVAWGTFMLPWFQHSPSSLVRALSPFGAAAGCFMLVCLVVHCIQRSRNDVRHRFGSYLASNLQCLSPSTEELAEVISKLRKSGSMVAKKVKAEWLREQIDDVRD